MSVRKIIAIILIVAGIGIAASPFIGEWLTYRRNLDMMQKLADYEKTFQSAEAIPTPTTDGSTPQPGETAGETATQPPADYQYQYLNIDNQSVIGIITIDKIKIKIPVVDGIENDNLRLAIGHFPESALPGQNGNVVLAGHRSYSFGQFFNRLDEVAIGDKIDLSFKGTTYHYTVYDIFEVLPDETWVLNQDKSEKIVTLITCTPVLVATHRLIVRARLDQ